MNKQELIQFVLQKFFRNVKEKSLKTKEFPKQYDEDIRISVSFGQGNLAYIPWISFLGDGQHTMNGIYPVVLYYQNYNLLILSYGVSESNIPELRWSNLDDEVPTVGNFLEYMHLDVEKAEHRYDGSFIHSIYSVKNHRLSSRNLDRMATEIIEMIDEYKAVLDGTVIPKSKHISDMNIIEDEEVWNWSEVEKEEFDISEDRRQILTAMRTKPFLLLAGISGTGKSRIVKELAYMSCPNYGGLRGSEVAPGNYCMIEVKPNWHDSTELLGYESMINKKYVLTPFVKFLIKAMQFPNVPFFVCLDEMNLAPVEQYFAEFLSVLESRKRLDDGRIVSEPLIKGEIFVNYGETKLEQSKQLGIFDEMNCIQEDRNGKEYIGDGNIRSWEDVKEDLKKNGLCIPANVIVVGTVNMDETTHQFSRKVIDRAMTIEMNIGEDKEKYFEDFFESNVSLRYYDNVVSKEMFLSVYTSALEAMDENKKDVASIKKIVPNLLVHLNECLVGTPFQVAYRVQNELIIYVSELRHEYVNMNFEELINRAMDDILMMKVLPRIEGDDLLLADPLQKLLEFCKNRYINSEKKIKDMQMRLDSHFTSYWP